MLGSRHLQQRLEESLRTLERIGARVPKHGRHRKAVTLLADWNNTHDEIDLSNTNLLARLESANRTAWETFLISVAAWHRRKRKDTLFTLEKLNKMFGGPEVETIAGEARDIQFELFLGAICHLASVDIEGGDPDLRFLYGRERVGIAAKRISSLVDRQVRRHVKKAVEQIHQSRLRGFLALNLDTRFRKIDITKDEGALLRQFEEAFDSVNTALNRYAAHDSAVLGFMMYGYKTAWHPDALGQPPRLQVANPFRWFALVDDPGEVLQYEQFTEGWRGRFESRINLLNSKDFTGTI